MSTLQIIPAQIPYQATVVSVLDSVDAAIASNDFRLPYNLAGGYRYAHYRPETGDSTVKLRFDLGDNFTNKDSKADTLVIARADILKIQGITDIVLSRSSDGSSFTDEFSDSSFGLATLVGPDAHDYIATFSETSQYRYWQLALSASGPVAPRLSKLYIAKSLDFSVDPSDFKTEILMPPESEWYSSAGVRFGQRTSDPVVQIEVEWEGLTDSEIDAFVRLCHANPVETPVFLYAPVQTQILDGHILVHAQLVQALWERIGGIDDYNRLLVTFRELKG